MAKQGSNEICSDFVAQFWKKNICKNCFRKEEDHVSNKKKPLETQSELSNRINVSKDKITAVSSVVSNKISANTDKKVNSKDDGHRFYDIHQQLPISSLS